MEIKITKDFYTMKDFEKMFFEASKEVLEEFDKKINTNAKENPLAALMFSLQNAMIIAMLQNKLFGEED